MRSWLSGFSSTCCDVFGCVTDVAELQEFPEPPFSSARFPDGLGLPSAEAL